MTLEIARVLETELRKYDTSLRVGSNYHCGMLDLASRLLGIIDAKSKPAPTDDKAVRIAKPEKQALPIQLSECSPEVVHLVRAARLAWCHRSRSESNLEDLFLAFDMFTWENDGKWKPTGAVVGDEPVD